MGRIILVTGGAVRVRAVMQRNWHSASLLTLSMLATARIWDEEFRKRVLRHQERRGPEWTNIEEEKELSHHSLSGRTILIDCVTLWCTNFFFDLNA